MSKPVRDPLPICLLKSTIGWLLKYPSSVRRVYPAGSEKIHRSSVYRWCFIGSDHSSNWSAKETHLFRWYLGAGEEFDRLRNRCIQCEFHPCWMECVYQTAQCSFPGKFVSQRGFLSLLRFRFFLLSVYSAAIRSILQKSNCSWSTLFTDDADSWTLIFFVDGYDQLEINSCRRTEAGLMQWSILIYERRSVAWVAWLPLILLNSRKCNTSRSLWRLIVTDKAIGFLADTVHCRRAVSLTTIYRAHQMSVK